MKDQLTKELLELKRRLQRHQETEKEAQRRHSGQELNVYTYHAGFDLGYVKGKIYEIENTISMLEELLQIKKEENTDQFPKNWLLLSEEERKDPCLLQKLKDWNINHSDVDWQTFKDNWFKCDKCHNYDTEQCICYTR